MNLLRFALGLLLSTPALAEPVPLALLRMGLGGARLEAVDTFAYRLTVTDPTTGRAVRDARYRLEAASGRLECDDLLTGQRSLWDGQQGWLLRDTQREPLPAAAAEALRDQAAYHFIRLLRDPATRVETVAARRLRLTPAGANAFEVIVDAGTGRILENHFDAGTVVHELDYQVVEGVAWPMAFEVQRDGVVTRRGQFTETAFTFRP